MTFISDDTEIKFCGKDMKEAYQQGRADMYDEICNKGYADGYDNGIAYIIEEIEKHIETHKRHIFGIGISQIIDADELMYFLLEQIKEQK